ncbi:MAG: nucleotide exchange factor GrpE [Planctomycetota bacterium]
MTKIHHHKSEEPAAHKPQGQEQANAPTQNKTEAPQSGQPLAQKPAAEPPQELPTPLDAPAPAPAGAVTLTEEAEAFCADLERFFRRAFGNLPKTSDLCELRAEQATVKDMVRRASAAGGEDSVKLATTVAERDKLKSALTQRDAAILQNRADFLNYQARTTKDLERAEESALRRYMLDLLPILDSLKLALQDAAAPTLDAQRLKDALGLIDTSLNQALAVRGLQRIVAEAGKPFDPTLHEAVALRPADPAKGEKPNTVLEELRAGYLWQGRVLRAAQVLVSEPEKQAKKKEAAEEKAAAP